MVQGRQVRVGGGGGGSGGGHGGRGEDAGGQVRGDEARVGVAVGVQWRREEVGNGSGFGVVVRWGERSCTGAGGGEVVESGWLVGESRWGGGGQEGVEEESF